MNSADRQLWAAYHADRSAAAFDALTVRYLPMVGYHAAALCRRLTSEVQHDDLAADGVLGLRAAILGYEPDRTGFSSYAGPRIRGAMLDAIRDQDWVPRLVRFRAAKADRIQHRAFALTGDRMGRDEASEQLRAADKHKWTDAGDGDAPAVLSLSRWNRHPNDDQDRSELGQSVPAGGRLSPDPTEEAERDDFWRSLRRMQRNPAAAEALELHYRRGMSMERIGNRLGFTQARVWQLIDNARRIVRARLTRERAGGSK